MSEIENKREQGSNGARSWKRQKGCTGGGSEP